MSPAHHTEIGDPALLESVRAGDADAYTELWYRHARAGHRMARALTDRFEPDDLVAEAFSRIYGLLVQGKGPRDAFRTYLHRTLKNISIDWSRGAKEVPLVETDSVEDPRFGEEALAASVDQSLILKALATLPDRWQEVLRLTQVEGLSPTETGVRMGLNANAVNALAYRAREGLRQAWIQVHLADTDTDGDSVHGWTIRRLGAWARADLSRRDAMKVEAHVRRCRRCRLVADEAEGVASRLAVALVPGLVAAGGGVGLFGWINATLGRASATAGASRAAAKGHSIIARSIVRLSSFTAVAAAATDTMVLTATLVVPLVATVPAVDSVPPTGPSAGSAPPSTPAGPARTPAATGAPATPPASTPAPTPVPNLQVATPVRTSPPDSASTVDIASVGSSETPNAVVPSAPAIDGIAHEITAGDVVHVEGSGLAGARLTLTVISAAGSQESIDITVPSTGRWAISWKAPAAGEYSLVAVQRLNGQTSAAAQVEGSVRPLAPLIGEVDTGPNGGFFPIVSGSGAPGAVVTVFADGVPVATVDVHADGSWRSAPLSSVAAPTVQLTATVAQNGVSSVASAAVTTRIAPPPSVAVLSSSARSVILSVNSGLRPFQVLIDGTVHDCSYLLTLASCGPLPPGPHQVSARWSDADRIGPASAPITVRVT